MAKFPTYEEMAKNVAEKALNDFLYNGKTIREWMQIIVSEDCISRQQAIDKMQELEDEDDEMYGCSIPEGFDGKRAIEALKVLPSIQPKEIYNKGWQDGAEATAYHVELCEKENPTIPMSVIEDIKAEIANTVLEESKQCDGDYAFLKWCAGLKYSLRIIDKHIEDIGGK